MQYKYVYSIHRKKRQRFKTDNEDFTGKWMLRLWYIPLYILGFFWLAPFNGLNFFYFLPSDPSPSFQLFFRWHWNSNPRSRTMAWIARPWQSPLKQKASLSLSSDDISVRLSINYENDKFPVSDHYGTDRDLVYIGLVPKWIRYLVWTEIPVSIPFQNKTKIYHIIRNSFWFRPLLW